MRPVIREQGKRQAAQLFGPGLEAGRRVGADLQDFDIEFLEFIVVRTEATDLILSPAGKGKRQERNDGAPAAETGERDFLVGVMCSEREIGRCGSSLNFHVSSPCRVRRQCRRITRA